MATDERELDVVLLGATGFTGGLAAAHLAGHAPAGLRWGIAGRSVDRLVAVREGLAAAHDVPVPEVVVADVTDAASLAALARRTRVLATTVGPYLEHGDGVVAACAGAGTDYCDLTGEPEFVDVTWLRHQATAVRTGARLVHACGFDSVPHDLGAYLAVRQLPEGVPIRLSGAVRARGAVSGGTLASALTALGRPRRMRRAAVERRQREEVPAHRRVRGTAGGPRREPGTGRWLVPLPTIDPQIVLRSARALERYGPDFGYAHYAVLDTLPAVAGAVGVAGGLVAAAQVPPLRRWLAGRVPPGSGPDESRRERSWFEVTFRGQGGDHAVRARVRGGDPGYGATAVMLAESALCLAVDDNPPCAGQVTTVQAMGDALTERLQRAGIRFEVLA